MQIFLLPLRGTRQVTYLCQITCLLKQKNKENCDVGGGGGGGGGGVGDIKTIRVK